MPDPTTAAIAAGLIVFVSLILLMAIVAVATAGAQRSRIDPDEVRAIARDAARAAISEQARKGANASNARQAERRARERAKVLDTAEQMRRDIAAKGVEA